MSDIANAIYRHLRTMAPHQLERLTAIQLKEAADEIARLRLTDEEQLAIAWAAREADEWDEEDTPEVAAHAEALRGLAERLF